MTQYIRNPDVTLRLRKWQITDSRYTDWVVKGYSVGFFQKAEAQLAYELQAAKIQQKIRNEEIQIQVDINLFHHYPLPTIIYLSYEQDWPFLPQFWCLNFCFYPLKYIWPLRNMLLLETIL